MKYTVKFSKQFKKDFKKAEKQHRDMDRLKTVIELLADGKELPEVYRDHELRGSFKGKRECHIQPDWLLIYEYSNDELILWLVRTGSHSELLDM